MHVIIAGCGRVGSELASNLERLGHSVAVVDKDGQLATSWTPDVEGPPSPGEAREWALLGWWAVRVARRRLARGEAEVSPPAA